MPAEPLTIQSSLRYKLIMDNVPEHDDAPLGPAEMLALVQRQQSDVARRTATLIPWILMAWGFAWLVGFLLLWLAAGPRLVSGIVAGWVFAALMVLGLVVSIIVGIRSGQGQRGTREESLAGMLFGFACTAGFVGVSVVGAALARLGMSDEATLVFYPVLYGLIVAVFYVAAGAVWRTAYPAYVGGWLVIVSLAAAFVPPPAHYLVFAIAGGGAFLLAGILLAAWSWKRVK